jgi:hypothetical protein
MTYWLKNCTLKDTSELRVPLSALALSAFSLLKNAYDPFCGCHPTITFEIAIGKLGHTNEKGFGFFHIRQEQNIAYKGLFRNYSWDISDSGRPFNRGKNRRP